MATDGEYGRLQQLILDPYQERVVALFVRKLSLRSPHTVFIPEEAVADITAGEVQLKISREQVDALPEYKPDSGLVVEGGSIG
jgi:sporulation protein YlmC with PRC-barrel domain